MQVYTGTSNLEHAWRKLQDVPTTFWLTLLTVMFSIWLIVRVWRALKDFNDFAPYVALFTVVLLGSFYVVYERKEPAFMTPYVDMVAKFLPSPLPTKADEPLVEPSPP